MRDEQDARGSLSQRRARMPTLTDSQNRSAGGRHEFAVVLWLVGSLVGCSTRAPGTRAAKRGATLEPEKGIVRAQLAAASWNLLRIGVVAKPA